MASLTNWVLTDVSQGIWLDTFQVDHGQMPYPSPYPWSIHKRTLHGGRSEGIDLIEVNNGALRFSLLPTRGLGLWRGDYHGLPLGWQAPIVGPVHPALVHPGDRNGLGWLDGFDEWVCRCGLHSNGPPVLDPARNELLPLHGRIANSPAHYVEVFLDQHAPRHLAIRGIVDEGTLFMGRLRLTTTIVTPINGNEVHVHDVVENLASQPADLQLLYHCQFGPPFLEAGSRVHVPARLIAPRDATAAKGVRTLGEYVGPTPGYAEQVYYYQPLANAAGQGLALLHNAAGDKGVSLRFDANTLPHFIVWKNTGAAADGYVTGLEPATNLPNAKPFERERGRVIQLAPGQRYETNLTFAVHDHAASVSGILTEIQGIQGDAPQSIYDRPIPEFSP